MITTKLRNEDGTVEEINLSKPEEFQKFANEKADRLKTVVGRKAEIEAEIARRHEELQNQINAEFGEEFEALEEEEGEIRDEVLKEMVQNAWKSTNTDNGLTFTNNEGKFTVDVRVARAGMSERTYNRVRKDGIDVKKLKEFFPGIARRAMVQGENYLSVRGL